VTHKYILLFLYIILWPTKAQCELISVPYQGIRYITVAQLLDRQQRIVENYRKTTERTFYSSKAV